MATRKIRVNLAATSFPLLSKTTGRSIMIPVPGGIEAAVVNNSTDPSTAAQTPTPQPLYMQNYLPIPAGLASVFIEKQENPSTPIAALKMKHSLYLLRDPLDTRVLYISDPLNNWIYDANVGTWKNFSVTVPSDKNNPTGEELVTVAYIKGDTYVCIDGYGLYKYNWDSQTFANISGLSGIDQYAVKGICSVGPYLLLFDANTIYWSNVNSPLDFTPSLVTGAGSSSVLAVRSPILLLSTVPDGFLIYTAHNAVSATVTGDMNTPFIFKEIEGFTGVTKASGVSVANSITTSQIAWTPTGLVEVNSQKTLNSFPELTVFIQGKVVEQYNELTKQLEMIIGQDVLNFKFRIIGGRYIAVSYSYSESLVFTHALIYDIGLKRWGKLAFNHIDIFEASVPSPYRRVRCSDVTLACNSTEPNWDLAGTAIKDRRCNTFTDVQLAYTDPAKILGIMDANGLLYTAEISTFETYNTDFGVAALPVVILGDYALERKGLTDIFKVEAEYLANNGAVVVETHIANSNNPMIVPTVKSPYDDSAFDLRTTGRSHKLHIEGNALLSTLVVEAGSSGYR